MASTSPAPVGTDTLTFVGTATTILRIGPFTLLTDPNFLRRGQRAYLGKGLWSRRLTDPAIGIGDLPLLDAVVLSHLHGDHWDRVARRGLDRSAPVVTTPQAARRLQRYGFSTQGLPTWGSHVLRRGADELAVVCARRARAGCDEAAASARDGKHAGAPGGWRRTPPGVRQRRHAHR